MGRRTGLHVECGLPCLMFHSSHIISRVIIKKETKVELESDSNGSKLFSMHVSQVQKKRVTRQD